MRGERDPVSGKHLGHRVNKLPTKAQEGDEIREGKKINKLYNKGKELLNIAIKRLIREIIT